MSFSMSLSKVSSRLDPSSAILTEKSEEWCDNDNLILSYGVVHVVDFSGTLIFLSYPPQPQCWGWKSAFPNDSIWVFHQLVSWLLVIHPSSVKAHVIFPWLLSLGYHVVFYSPRNNPLNRPVRDSAFLSSHLICLLLYWVVWRCMIYQHHIVMSIFKTCIPKFIKKKIEVLQ